MDTQRGSRYELRPTSNSDTCNNKNYTQSFPCFPYKKHIETTTNILVQNLKGSSNIMLLRAWGIISELIAFSQDLGGGELTVSGVVKGFALK